MEISKVMMAAFIPLPFLSLYVRYIIFGIDVDEEYKGNLTDSLRNYDAGVFFGKRRFPAFAILGLGSGFSSMKNSVISLWRKCQGNYSLIKTLICRKLFIFIYMLREFTIYAAFN